MQNSGYLLPQDCCTHGTGTTVTPSWDVVVQFVVTGQSRATSHVLHPIAPTESHSSAFPCTIRGLTVIVTLHLFALQNGLDKRVERSRKQMKERRNRARKLRGVKKATGE